MSIGQTLGKWNNDSSSIWETCRKSYKLRRNYYHLNSYGKLQSIAMTNLMFLMFALCEVDGKPTR